MILLVAISSQNATRQLTVSFLVINWGKSGKLLVDEHNFPKMLGCALAILALMQPSCFTDRDRYKSWQVSYKGRTKPNTVPIIFPHRDCKFEFIKWKALQQTMLDALLGYKHTAAAPTAMASAGQISSLNAEEPDSPPVSLVVQWVCW